MATTDLPSGHLLETHGSAIGARAGLYTSAAIKWQHSEKCDAKTRSTTARAVPHATCDEKQWRCDGMGAEKSKQFRSTRSRDVTHVAQGRCTERAVPRRAGTATAEAPPRIPAQCPRPDCPPCSSRAPAWWQRCGGRTGHVDATCRNCILDASDFRWSLIEWRN